MSLRFWAEPPTAAHRTTKGHGRGSRTGTGTAQALGTPQHKTPKTAAEAGSGTHIPPLGRRRVQQGRLMHQIPFASLQQGSKEPDLTLSGTSSCLPAQKHSGSFCTPPLLSPALPALSL